MINDLNKIRSRARKSKSLTGKQAKQLLEDRDYYFKLLLGSQYALSGLRAFMVEDAPEWVKKNIKSAMDTNDSIIVEYEKFVKEHEND